MRAGELRHRVTIQQSVAINVGGVPVGDWQDVCTFSAKIEDLSGRESFGQGAIAADSTNRIVARWRSGLTAAMRALSGARLFEIQSITDPEGRGREMHLLCKERFDGGAAATAAVVAARMKHEFSGAIDGANRAFVLDVPVAVGSEFVIWNGLKQAQDGMAYGFDGQTLVMSQAPAAGDALEIYAWPRRGFTGALDGVNRTFVLDTTILVGSEFVLWNGLKQAVDSYSFDGTTLVMSAVPEDGDTLEIYG